MEDFQTDGRVTLKAVRGSSTQIFEMSERQAAATAERLRAGGWLVAIAEGHQPYFDEPVESHSTPRRSA